MRPEQEQDLGKRPASEVLLIDKGMEQVIQTLSGFVQENFTKEQKDKLRDDWSEIEKANCVLPFIVDLKADPRKQTQYQLILFLMQQIVGLYEQNIVTEMKITDRSTQIPQKMILIIRQILEKTFLSTEKHSAGEPTVSSVGVNTVTEKAGSRFRNLFRLPWGKK